MPVQTLKILIATMKSGLFFQIVNSAYRQPDKTAHLLIRAVARKYFGRKKMGRLARFLSQWFLDCITKAQLDFFEKNGSRAIDLGVAGVGFRNIIVRCSTENANSSSVYLLGFEPNLTHFDVYRLFAQPATVAVDVGANLGIHSVVLAACVGAGGKVYAFEPVPSIREKLEENLKINRITNVQLCEYALGNSLGKVSFRANTEDFNIGKGRVDPEGSLSVPVTTIDHEIGDVQLPVSMIKIDTEGHELEVLKGAAGLLEKHRPVVVMEFNFKSYSLPELTRHIPSGYSYFELPKLANQRYRRVDGDLRHDCDIVVVPDEKLAS